MKNKITLLIGISTALAAGIGCSSLNPFGDNSAPRANTSTQPTGNQNTSNKSLSDRAIDTAIGEKKLGVPECDEVMDMLTSYANNPDDNFAIRAGKAIFVNQIKETIKQAVEENQADKAELAKVCREAKIELEKYRSKEQQSNK